MVFSLFVNFYVGRLCQKKHSFYFCIFEQILIILVYYFLKGEKELTFIFYQMKC